MRKTLPIIAAALIALGSISLRAEEAKTAAPSQDVDVAALQVRASQAVSAKEWTTALPLLKKVAEKVKDQPERLGQIEEQIRVCEKNIAKQAKAGLSAKPQAGAAASVPLQTPGVNVPTSAETRKPHAPVKDGQTVELGIKELGNFDYDQDKGGNIPPDVKQLSGSTVRLRGYMIPMDQADNITKFALVPDLFACCFGQPPQIQHMVVANCPTGKAVSYSPDEILVEGKLNVDEKKDDGYIISIFEVSVASVKAAPR
jgi:hypothetical protein